MKSIKNKDLRQLPAEELEKKLIELKMELMKENAQVAMRTVPKNPGLLKANKKMVARILGLLNESKNSNKLNKKTDMKKQNKLKTTIKKSKKFNQTKEE